MSDDREYYRLQGKEIVPCDRETFFNLKSTEFNVAFRVGWATNGETIISTIMNQNPGFETIVFGGPYSGQEWTHETFDAALAFHLQLCEETFK